MRHLIEARGRGLDFFGDLYGVPRRRWLWLFRERDSKYRTRIMDEWRPPKLIIHVAPGPLPEGTVDKIKELMGRCLKDT